MRMLWKFLALGAFFAAAAVGLAACGGDSVPGNAVARVGDDTITKSQFNHWVAIAARSAQSSQEPGAAAKGVEVPQPPDFKQCIEEKRKTAPKPAKGQPKPTDAQFKSQCQSEYNSLRDQVMQFLISSAWIQNEAKDQGVSVSDKDVKKQFDQTKKQSFPKEKDFQTFLENSGMSLDDIMFRVRLDTLSNKLRQKIVKGQDKVDKAAIARYYNKNKKQFAQPERRDLRVVLTKTTARAQEAKRALQSGQSWKTVAKKFSIDQASKNQGGVLLAVAKGQQERSFDQAIFAAQKGQLSGPVKTQFGYYVFMVTKVTAASQQTVAQATPTIKQLLTAQSQQKALDSFVKDFRKKWTGKTNCAKGFVTVDCKNAPKKKTTTAAPGQAPPPQTGTATTG